MVILQGDQTVLLSLLLTFSALIFAASVIWRTRHRKATKQLHRRFQALADYSIHPNLLKDNKGKILYASRSLHDLLGIHPDEIIGQDLTPLVHPDDQAKFKEFYKSVSRTHNTRQHLKLRLRNQTGEWKWVQNDVLNLLKHHDIRAVVATLQDISTQKRLDEQRITNLARARQATVEAEQAVRSRDEFLSVASHELKTPLTTVLLQIQKTMKQILTQSLADFEGEKLLSSLRTVESQGQRLAFMIKDLLNVSLISTGQIKLVKQEVKLDKLLKSIVTRFREQSKSPIKIVTKNQIVGNWDEIRLEQILGNVIGNAIKYGRNNPITVRVSKETNFARIAITDQGDGIDKNDLRRLFKLFERGSKNRHTGLGVGLFISRQIARSHGGDLTVKTEKNKGSTFILTLPLNKPES